MWKEPTGPWPHSGLQGRWVWGIVEGNKCWYGREEGVNDSSGGHRAQGGRD